MLAFASNVILQAKVWETFQVVPSPIDSARHRKDVGFKT